MNAVNTKLITAIELQTQGKNEEAAVLFRQILEANPNDAAALYSLSVILLKSGDHAAGLHLIESGVKAAPHYAPMWFVRGAALQDAGRKKEALQSYDRAVELDPKYTEPLINSGVLLRDMLRHHEALIKFNQVLSINPNHEGALCNCGILLTEFKQSEEAIAMFDRLLKINPDYDYGLGLLCHERLHICDWKDFDSLAKAIVEGVRAGKRVCKTLALMAISGSVIDHFLAASIFAQRYPKAKQSLWQGERYKHDKIRIAYVSADLREHPVGHLMAGVLERHDKSRFEVTAISLGIDDKSRLRVRMEKAFDRFVDVKELGSRQIAELIRELEIDIAVDLAGYTSDSRIEIFAHRPAPVQVTYLGYPGTLGTDYFDYILADRYVIPPEHQRYYSEKVIYLPDTYLPTDAGIKISDRTPTREECGLPETGVIFCSFSHDYKIHPEVFDVWMRILRQIPGSILWLMSRNELSQVNLRLAAEMRGVAPERLVFASRVPLVEDHLARYRLADVFLDTSPYNAHSTAADALMAGLPVVTYMGKAFPARVAASLLHAIGLAELITHSLEEYETLTLKLVTNPLFLADLKIRLKNNIITCPLFKTEDFCRNLEAAYIAMWRQYQLGNAHDALSGNS